LKLFFFFRIWVWGIIILFKKKGHSYIQTNMNRYYVMFRDHVLQGPLPSIEQFGKMIQKYKQEFPDVGDGLFRLLNTQILLRRPISSPENIRIDTPVNVDDLWVQWCKLLYILYGNVHPEYGPNEDFEVLMISNIPILQVGDGDSDDGEMDVDLDSRILERKKSNLRDEVEVLVSTETVTVSLFDSGWLRGMMEEEEDCNREIEKMNLKAIAWNVISGRAMARMTPVRRCTHVLKLMFRMLPSQYWNRWHPYSRLAWSDAEDGPVLRAFHALYSRWVFKITTAIDLATLSDVEDEIRKPTGGLPVMFPCPRHCQAGGHAHLTPPDVCMQTLMPTISRAQRRPCSGSATCPASGCIGATAWNTRCLKQIPCGGRTGHRRPSNCCSWR